MNNERKRGVDSLSGWTKGVKKGDYIKVISNSNFADESLREVTDITEKSIFVSRMQFSKETKNQVNMKRRIEPFMAQHLQPCKNAHNAQK